VGGSRGGDVALLLPLSLTGGLVFDTVLVVLCCSWRSYGVSSGGGGSFGSFLEVGCGLGDGG
jgi:hypothetical protein